MKKRLRRGLQSQGSQQEMRAEIDRRILAELQLQEANPHWNRVRAALLESPTSLRDLRGIVIRYWRHSIAAAHHDDYSRLGDVFTNEQLDSLLQKAIRTAIPEVLRDLDERHLV
jgi:hypothetical protein